MSRALENPPEQPSPLRIELHNSLAPDGEEFRVIFEGASRPPPIAIAFDPPARERILAATKLNLRIPPTLHAGWWKAAEERCSFFATYKQYENHPDTRLDDWRKLDASAEKLTSLLEPIMKNNPYTLWDGTPLPAAFGSLHVLRTWIAQRIAGARRGAPRSLPATDFFVRNLGALYSRGFGKKPGSASAGHFPQFVSACAAEITRQCPQVSVRLSAERVTDLVQEINEPWRRCTEVELKEEVKRRAQQDGPPDWEKFLPSAIWKKFGLSAE